MDIADLIDSFSAGSTLTVTRRAAASYSYGRATPGSTTTFTITARPRPASGRELERLPEGRRTTETRVFDTTVELYAGGQGAAYEADLVTIDGQAWEVQQVQRWPEAVVDVPAYTVTCQRPAT